MTMIGVYADWEGLNGPKRIGFLHSRRTRARELFEFEYDVQALADPQLNFLPLDPEIGLFAGAQYPTPPRDKFGMFGDSSPDRWGRMLMKRRLERDIREGIRAEGTQLYESDYLLGVHDLYRVGALRYRLEDEGEFLDNRIDIAAPPFTEIAALERASRALEDDPDNRAHMGQEWLRMLIAPGGSLVVPAQRPALRMTMGIFISLNSPAPEMSMMLAAGRWSLMRLPSVAGST
ncbi:toxin HipA [Enterobacter hormaechei]|nr:toxin HipA [Enterobacter hormaechei]WKB01451.1 toxin HipA [Enterobacter hormaechei]WKG20224.1 toxin HipA [Enterobacter hormaechei subsp. xiangfangensis]